MPECDKSVESVNMTIVWCCCTSWSLSSVCLAIVMLLLDFFLIFLDFSGCLQAVNTFEQRCRLSWEKDMTIRRSVCLAYSDSIVETETNTYETMAL